MNCKLYFLQIVLLVALPVFPQVINSAKELRSDDVLHKQQIVYESILEEDNDIIGNLSSMEVSDNQHEVGYRKVGKDTIIGYESGVRTYYFQSPKELLIVGAEDRLSTISYDMPEAWLRYPMNIGDSINGFFHGKGDYCHQLFIRIMGTYKTIADRQGSLLLPNGDTLRHVMRLRTERFTTTSYRPMESVFAEYGSADNAPVFTIDSIALYMKRDTVPVRTVHYRWYAEGYRYPVLETIAMMEKDSECPQLTAALYYSPEEQLRLALDEENNIARAELQERTGTNIGDAGTKKLNYQLSHQDYDHRLTVNYVLSETVKLKLLLCNIQGVVCQSAEQQGEVGMNSFTLDYGQLRPGQYLLYILADQESYIEKLRIR